MPAQRLQIFLCTNDYSYEYSHVHRFCNNKIVRAYALVLKDYHKNADSVNHAVVKMLHRIAVELRKAPLLYHISIFRTMQAILQEPQCSRYRVSSTNVLLCVVETLESCAVVDT